MTRIRTFLNANVPPEQPRDLAIRAEHVSSWAPSALADGVTVVFMISGDKHRITTPFAEFHEWMCPKRDAVPVAQDTRVNKRDLNGTTRR